MWLGEKVKLSPAAEEVAVFFAQMLDHEYTTKKVFRENFFKDWRKVWPKDGTFILLSVGVWFLSGLMERLLLLKQVCS